MGDVTAPCGTPLLMFVASEVVFLEFVIVFRGDSN